MKILRVLSACLLLLASICVQAAELRPFGRGDMARLLAEHQGRPFILTLWSTDCPHCKGTLHQLALWAKLHPAVDLVVVNTDGPYGSALIRTMLKAVGLGERDTWVFADASAERMRYEIDRRWGGEMPRTYLFDGNHQSAAFSGPIDPLALQQWAAPNSGNAPEKVRP
jgi:thiol-disulfide isomerase/thioredoxin